MRPRLIRSVEPPLGLYFRPGRNDHQKLLALIAEGQASFSGLVMDACLVGRQDELLREAPHAGVETVLDPRTAELATVTGFTRAGVGQLAWAGAEPHLPGDLRGGEGERMADEIASFVAKHGYRAVLAPTHILQSAEDPWLEVDGELTRATRRALDVRGLRDVPLYYPLAVGSTAFREERQRERLRSALKTVPVDAVWLRISPFGATSGPMALKRYIEACIDLQLLGIPLVGEHVGAAGLPLLAFGALGGIESGVTLGERFDARPLSRISTQSTPFSPPPRVYFAELGAFLSRKDAAAFFENRQMKTRFGCKHEHCCRRGWEDTLTDPRRHFLLRRSAEVARLSRAPSTLRPQVHLDEFLRPATDLGVTASKVAPGFAAVQHRLEGWRVTLGAMVRDGYVAPHAEVPQGRRTIARIGA